MSYKEKYRIENADAFEKAKFLYKLLEAIATTFTILLMIATVFTVSMIDAYTTIAVVTLSIFFISMLITSSVYIILKTKEKL